jgi:hypothetical protein
MKNCSRESLWFQKAIATLTTSHKMKTKKIDAAFATSIFILYNRYQISRYTHNPYKGQVPLEHERPSLSGCSQATQQRF